MNGPLVIGTMLRKMYPKELYDETFCVIVTLGKPECFILAFILQNH